jgi:AcrR family transcriptional regulator
MPSRPKLASNPPPQAPDAPKRDAILDAALELFAERGFHGTAVPLVAEKAKVGAGTLYRYFTSKEALANALFQRSKMAFTQAVFADLDPGVSLREMFRRTWRNMLAFHQEHPLVLAFLELHNHRSYLDEQSLVVEQRALGPIRDLILAAQKKGVIKPIGPELCMALVFGAFVGLLRAAHEGFLPLTEKIVDDSEAALWEAIST